jgi:O-antigen/teichoic acid export membrane protein
MSADPSLRRDILSAYAASIARVLSWMIVGALVYRRSPDAFAMLALVRGTLGILNYCSLGLLPAMIQAMASIPTRSGIAIGERRGEGDEALQTNLSVSPDQAIPLAYVTPQTTRDQRDRWRPRAEPAVQQVFGAGMTIAVMTAFLGTFLAILWAARARSFFRIPGSVDYRGVRDLVLFFGAGFAVRWLGDPLSALLQMGHRIAVDNLAVCLAELAWVVMVVAFQYPVGVGFDVRNIGLTFAISSVALTFARAIAAGIAEPVRFFLSFNGAAILSLLSAGLLITLAQLADYLYAPTDYILINQMLSARDLAAYAPAIQIDAGLMILVTGLASVLLPKAALAHAAGNRDLVRRYYVRGTLASTLLLATAAILVWIPSPLIFKIWFGNPMDRTQAILPLVLCHTVIGGSSAVGRSILLALGRTKPFTVSVLLAGITNVAASYAFVRYLHLGLAGIVLGTIVAVVARCGIWMPWYILRELRRGATGGRDIVEPPV